MATARRQDLWTAHLPTWLKAALAEASLRGRTYTDVGHHLGKHLEAFEVEEERVLRPTAALRSAATLPLHLAQNGVNFNLQLAPWIVSGPDGARTLQQLIDGGFAAGCMQMQVNVYDPKILIEARDHPGRYPGLLVRVSGYSAYFDDLSPEMKEEIIQRTLHDAADGQYPADCLGGGR